jgi:tetraacyldisaccharide 4'-kinase
MGWRKRGRRTRFDKARVISFGNLTAGGTGKTPAVIAQARLEVEAGHHVAVLTRGYGAPRHSSPIAVLPDDPRPNLGRHIGDEPALILRRAPGVMIVKSPNRVEAAWVAIYEYGCDTLILDDGYQYLGLERDENILLLDAACPFGNGHLLPRGILRERPEAINRATEIILTRCDQVEDLSPLLDELAVLAPGVPIRRTVHRPSSLWRVQGGGVLPLKTLRGQRVTALCGIARPEAFLQTLEDLGASIVDTRIYRDHAPIPPQDIPTSGTVITTEKDAMRLGRVGEHVLALGIELRTLD